VSADEKECPFCFEVVKARAIVCRYCGRDLLNEPAAAVSPSTPAAPAPATVPHPKSTPPARIAAVEVAGLLSALVSRSLVAFDETTGRYRLPETVREYARDRHMESDEGQQWGDRHLAHFTALGEKAEPHLAGGAEQEGWPSRLEAEHDNLRAALERASERGSDPGAGLRLAGQSGGSGMCAVSSRKDASESPHCLEGRSRAGVRRGAPARSMARECLPSCRATTPAPAHSTGRAWQSARSSATGKASPAR
jgi:hypothetical protein